MAAVLFVVVLVVVFGGVELGRRGFEDLCHDLLVLEAVGFGLFFDEFGCIFELLVIRGEDC